MASALRKNATLGRPESPALELCSRAFCAKLEVADEGELPNRFLIFKPGINATSKGDFVFDKRAAANVMAQYAREGVDLIVDREHDSLNANARAARRDAGDALAHFTIELAEDGSLWATNVVWNSEGESDLRTKKRRYTSPAFAFDKKTGRIKALVNVALVSMPATYENAPLIAARRRVTLSEIVRSYSSNTPAAIQLRVDRLIAKVKKDKAHATRPR